MIVAVLSQQFSLEKNPFAFVDVSFFVGTFYINFMLLICDIHVMSIQLFVAESKARRAVVYMGGGYSYRSIGV